MTKPEMGEKAPDFTLVNQDMKPTSLKDHRGHKVVLAFYPGAYTGVCKKELCTLRDSIARLEELDAQILAISVNDPFTNKAFHDENDLNFPLLCDYNREAVKKYNVVHENFAGLKCYTAAKRSVFIVDEEGVIRYKWVSEDPRVERGTGEEAQTTLNPPFYAPLTARNI
jgi:peroxiredoxin